MHKLTSKETKAISLALTAWGILLITSGTIMNYSAKPTRIVRHKLEVTQKRVAETKTNEIKLKTITTQINEPLSVKVEDYLENSDQLDITILKKLKLDTSMVNINEAGTYKYTITFDKKQYNGIYTIKEKELPKVELTLKNLKISLGSAISTEISTYVEEILTEEIKNNIILDLSAISTSEAGIYQYTITYNQRLYTGTIEVYEPQMKVITPNQIEDKNGNKDTTNDNMNEEKDNNDTTVNTNDNTNEDSSNIEQNLN